MCEQFKHAERILPRSALYVSADLSVVELSATSLVMYAEDLTQRDEDGRLRAYRRLGIEWYQWLYHRMRKLQELHQAGEINQASWDAMRERFNRLWAWMRERFDGEQIHQAEASYSDARYLPPEIRDPRRYMDLFRVPARDVGLQVLAS